MITLPWPTLAAGSARWLIARENIGKPRVCPSVHRKGEGDMKDINDGLKPGDTFYIPDFMNGALRAKKRKMAKPKDRKWVMPKGARTTSRQDRDMARGVRMKAKLKKNRRKDTP